MRISLWLRTINEETACLSALMSADVIFAVQPPYLSALRSGVHLPCWSFDLVWTTCELNLAKCWPVRTCCAYVVYFMECCTLQRAWKSVSFHAGHHHSNGDLMFRSCSSTLDMEECKLRARVSWLTKYQIGMTDRRSSQIIDWLETVEVLSFHSVTSTSSLCALSGSLPCAALAAEYRLVPFVW